MNVLVLNCGSSSIKYQLLNMDAVPVVLAKGIVEKIGLTYGSFTYKPEGKDKVVAEQPIMDHSVGMDLILKALVHPDHGVLKSLNEIDAVGHRVAARCRARFCRRPAFGGCLRVTLALRFVRLYRG